MEQTYEMYVFTYKAKNLEIEIYARDEKKADEIVEHLNADSSFVYKRKRFFFKKKVVVSEPPLDIEERQIENADKQAEIRRIRKKQNGNKLPSIYEEFDPLSSPYFEIRLLKEEDADSLFLLYSDERAYPFLNSDNCDDDFHYKDLNKMRDVVSFWLEAQKNRWFSRLVITKKGSDQIVGCIELCLRVSNDAFNNTAILRFDMKPEFEDDWVIRRSVIMLIDRANEYVGGSGVITKSWDYATERNAALEKMGFTKCEEKLIGEDGTEYGGYWIYNKKEEVVK